MEVQKTATLTTIFSEVLANLAFMFTDEETAEPSAGDLWLETTIRYDGTTKGTLAFRCTREFSILLAANLLGIDPRDIHAESQADDAVKEFMNIVCGQFVTASYGSNDVFNLSIPKIRELPETPDFSQDDGITTSTLSADDHRVQLAHETIDDDAP